MVRIVLIRPGCTDYDDQGRIQGTLEMPLCEAGGREASKMANTLQGLGIQRIYTSDSNPALETAAILSSVLGVKVKKLENMQNLDLGLWQGLLVEEVKRKQPKVYRQWQEHPEVVRPPQGETVAEAQERVAHVLQWILRKHPDGVIAVLLPEPLASLARQKLAGSLVGDLWQASTGHGHYEVIEVEPRSLAVTARE
jgi:broad specificity phosphatase PhoE